VGLYRNLENLSIKIQTYNVIEAKFSRVLCK